MIKLTLNDIMRAVQPLRQLSEKSFRGATSFKIARLIRELDNELQLFDKNRMEVIKKYAETDEDGRMKEKDGNVQILEGEIDNCNKELQELFEAEVEINAEKIPIEVFESIELSPAQALELEAIIDFE